MRNIRIVLLLSILTFFSCDSNNPVPGTGNRSNITGTSGCGGFDRVKLENSLIINRDDNKTYFIMSTTRINFTLQDITRDSTVALPKTRLQC